MQYDTIIIGSGAGGLSAAIALAKSGQKVLVLEQHYVAGGWCHSFSIKKSRFTPGIHYIGLLGEGESTRELYQGLGIANDLVFFRMNPKGYEHCHIGSERFDIPSDITALQSALIARFPQEKKGIVRYLKTVKDVSRELQLIPKMNGFLDTLTIVWRTRHFGKYALFSLKRVIGWHLKDPLLKQILNVQCGDHGLPPGKASFPLHCAVMDHYFSGGYYPMGGGGAIVNAMIKAIEKDGGEVRTRQKVARIIIEGEEKKRACGVELAGGEKLYAKQVLSNADPSKTYLDLIGREYLSTALREKLDETRYSCTSLMLFVSTTMDMREAGLDSGNIWVMPHRDMDEVYDEMMRAEITDEAEFSGLFISCTTLKDPSSFDGKHHTLEVITFIDYDAFEAFENEDKKRSQAYIEYKARLKEKMLRSLQKCIPGIQEHIVHSELATPLTNEYYINATRGNVYGTQKSLDQIGPNGYQPQSEIENLHLCGASVLSHGVAGASYSGVQAAAKILGCRAEELIEPDETQQLRVYEAEDDSAYPQWLKEIIAGNKME